MPEVSYGLMPCPWDWTEVTGIFVGGCVERGVGSSFRHQAHAHTAGDSRGMICVRSRHRIFIAGTDRPTRVMWHEYSHILTGHGHDDIWRAMMRTLGQPIPKRYQRKVRK